MPYLLPHIHSHIIGDFLKLLIGRSKGGDLREIVEILSALDIDLFVETEYMFVSVAQLLATPEDAQAIAEALDVDDDALFYLFTLKGDNDKALHHGKIFLEKYQKSQNHKRKDLPGLLGVLYGLVLLVSGNEADVALAATFVRSTMKRISKTFSYGHITRLCKLLILYSEHLQGKREVTLDVFEDDYEMPIYRYFALAVAHWMGKSKFIDKDDNGFLRDHKDEFEFRAAGGVFLGESSEKSALRLKELKNRFQFLPLVDIIKPKQPWESILDFISNELSKSDDEVPSADKRLVWRVDPCDLNSLECIEQTKLKSGWNTGKSRSLAMLVKNIPDFASVDDRDIIGLLNFIGGRDVQILNTDKMYRKLATHPDVYSLQPPYTPITISVQDVQVKVKKNDGDLDISLSPTTPEITITQVSPSSYVYHHWSAKARRIHSVMTDSGLKKVTIPESQIAKAQPVIDRLHEIFPTTGDAVTYPCRNSDSVPVLQLTPVNKSLHVQFLIEIIDGEETRFAPGVGLQDVVMRCADNQMFSVGRNKERELAVMGEIAGKISLLGGMDRDNSELLIDDDISILDLLFQMKENAPDVKLIWPKGANMKIEKVLTYSDFNVNIGKAGDWFAVDGDVTINENISMSIAELLKRSGAGRNKYIKIDDKTYIGICKDLQKRIEMLDVAVSKKGDKLMFHPLGYSNIESFSEDMKQLKVDKAWKQHVEKLESLKDYVPSLPSNLKAELRPYQQDGVLWLDRLYNWGVGGCLADDMGLGKTVQVISILLKYGGNGPSLVLAPSSVCYNWRSEINRFAPTLNVHEFNGAQNRNSILQNLGKYDVLVVSYGLLQANPDLLSDTKWNIAVLDEAHAIKNSNSVRSKAVMKLNASFRVITTGTPVQNHHGELWNLFQFINPGLLGSYDSFTSRYVKGDADNEQSRKALNRYIAPYILRRLKTDVLDDLPEKTEITLRISLSDEERAMYENLRVEALNRINEGDAGARQMQILAEITRLRLMSCNSQLVNPDIVLPSSKLEALVDLIDDFTGTNHKALIFSQFTSHLGIIRKMLDDKMIAYQYLDGSTPMKAREAAVAKFQNGDADLFLISLKAGGVGLNLTAADYVIHMDPWWNPAVEDQASDRAHRIGQKRPVTIYRLIAENTIEDKIVNLHQTKRDLADQLLADTDRAAHISTSELLSLISEK